jgi:hypothetical protein
MTCERLTQWRALLGRQVCLALTDGSRLDDCQLVSLGPPRVETVWLFTGAEDVFVPLAGVLDLWEAAPLKRSSSRTN